MILQQKMRFLLLKTDMISAQWSAEAWETWTTTDALRIAHLMASFFDYGELPLNMMIFY